MQHAHRSSWWTDCRAIRGVQIKDTRPRDWTHAGMLGYQPSHASSYTWAGTYCFLRMVSWPGLTSALWMQVGPAGAGVISVGTRALSESGAVGNFAREQIELFCVSELVNCFLDSDEEFLYLDGAFSSGLAPASMPMYL